MGSPAIFAGKRSKLLSSKGLLYSNGSINDYNGDINYILNGHAEVNTTGWATYADAAQSTPVNGTGGSPSVTWTQTTTSPLDDLGSFVFTKDAVNRQGQGASYDFTIDRASQAKVMTITCDYIIDSGTFVAGANGVDSDLEVYIYDVTNSVLIQPSTYKLYSNSSTVASQFIANFQTPYNSTSYRLIIHCATTSASAYTVKFDNVKVSPTQYTYGTPITDWQPYTLTIGGATPPTPGAGATKLAWWRRVGDSMQISFVYYQSAAGSAGSGQYLLPLPSGYSIDTNKSTTGGFALGTNASAVGSGYLSNTQSQGVATYGAATVCIFNSNNLILVAAGIGSLGQGSTWGSGAVTLGSTTVYAAFNASVPITGWSSSTQMSDSFVWADDVGSITPFAVSSSTPPAGYLYCDGTAVSRTIYADLYAKIGTSFGSGDGLSTFNLPDYRGMFLRGLINIPAVTGTGTAASSNATFTNHGLRTGMRVRMTSGALSPLATGTNYYAIRIDANTLAFATTQALATATTPTKIAITGANSAVIQQWMDPDASTRVAPQNGANTGVNIGSHQDDQNLNHTHTYNAHTIVSNVVGGVAGFPGPDNSVNMTATTSSGGNQSNPVNSYVNYFIKHVRGPAPVVGMSETVAALANTSTQAVTNNTLTTIICSSILSNTHGAYSSSTGIFTCPSAGYLDVAGGLNTTGTASGVTANLMFVYKNSTEISRVGSSNTQSANTVGISITNFGLPVVAGDQITVRYIPQGWSPTLGNAYVSFAYRK